MILVLFLMNYIRFRFLYGIHEFLYLIIIEFFNVTIRFQNRFDLRDSILIIFQKLIHPS